VEEAGAQFACLLVQNCVLTSTKVQILTKFLACFTSTKVQILTRRGGGRSCSAHISPSRFVRSCCSRRRSRSCGERRRRRRNSYSSTSNGSETSSSPILPRHPTQLRQENTMISRLVLRPMALLRIRARSSCAKWGGRMVRGWVLMLRARLLLSLSCCMLREQVHACVLHVLLDEGSAGGS
jgi:hypothetical protein